MGQPQGLLEIFFLGSWTRHRPLANAVLDFPALFPLHHPDCPSLRWTRAGPRATRSATSTRPATSAPSSWRRCTRRRRSSARRRMCFGCVDPAPVGLVAGRIERGEHCSIRRMGVLVQLFPEILFGRRLHLPEAFQPQTRIGTNAFLDIFGNVIS